MELNEFFAKNRRIAIGFSGGVDSAYLLLSAVECGAEVTAYYVKTAFQPQREYDEVVAFANKLGVRLEIITYDIFKNSNIIKNDIDRCYHCKLAMFSAIAKRAKQDQFSVICDGTNASDDTTDRPGLRALAELQIVSPLAMCGVTKAMVRTRLKEADISFYNKPAYACLATRIPSLVAVTQEKLHIIEQAENKLFSLGFTEFRVKLGNTTALCFAEYELNKAQQMAHILQLELNDICGETEVQLLHKNEKQWLI
ncbi:MAG: ATP-dependent sacrificial sulfur transferase LarE [Bacillota bacterium]